MLIHLHVKNLALIEDIEVEFGPGLNILTGETGAGKSILLGSMQLILGGRSTRDMIRAGASYALVELLFQVENPRLEETFKEIGVELENGQILLTRKIMDGRSISKINGETCTVGQMKVVASGLLDIHGQHEHQSLLYQDKQLEILDAYGKDQIYPASARVHEVYREYRKCMQELKALDTDEEQRNRERAFLEFEISEIEAAQLRPGEDEELEGLYRKLNNGKKILETLQSVRDLTGYDSAKGAGDAVGMAVRELTRVTEFDSELESMSGMLQEVDSLLNDFNREVASYVEDLNFDDETFFETEKRLDLINNLKAKYGQSIEEIQKYGEHQKQKLEDLDRYEEHFRSAKENLEKTQKKLEEVSYALSEIRKKYSKTLTEKIIEGLKDLNFLDVQFRIDFKRKEEYTAGGFDEVEYEISTNPGESVKPLGRIVSGGELSRIMLALKAILADRDPIETLIFDEIDTGISGRTAQKVSEKMAVIGRHHQVICITHLPQIAAMADTHFEIEKHQRGTATITEIHPLEGEDSVRELARLLGGAEITQAVFQNAKEMKELAQVHKNTRVK